MSETAGVYKRGEVWWYRVGRDIRRSSQSGDREVAVAMRERALQIRREARAVKAATRRSLKASTEWQAWVQAQGANSDGWLHRTHRHMRRKTRLRNWIECLTLDELADLAIESNGHCALTGLPFSRKPRHPFAISIDRIDSGKGYCAGNVRLVLLAVNLGMSHWGEDAFRSIARALVGRELLKPLHNPLHSGVSLGDSEE